MLLPKTLFIIDDDYDDREMFLEAVVMVHSTINCLEFSNGKDAIQILKNCQPYPNVIFLDLNMTGISGLQCLKQIKEDPSVSHIPVVIYTTSSQSRDKDETAKFGASYFLTKPVSSEELKNELEHVFKTLSNNLKTA